MEHRKIKDINFKDVMIDLDNYTVEKVAIKYNISRPTLRKYVLKFFPSYFKNRQRSNTYSYSLFKEINNEISAYWLGFMYADGNIITKHNSYMIRLMLSIKDKNELLKFYNHIGAHQKLNYDMRGNGCIGITITNKELGEDLINKGCMPNKTFLLKFPTQQQVPSHLINHFIRGYFDGDGSIYKTSTNGHGIEFIGTYNLLYGISNVLYQWGTKLKIPAKHHTSNIYRLHYGSKNDISIIFKHFYINSNIYLNRKYQRFLKALDLYVKNVKKCSIDNCDGKYLAKGYCKNHYAQFMRNALNINKKYGKPKI